MARTVNIPGVGPAEFPDDMTDEQIASVIQRQFPHLAPQPDPAREKRMAMLGTSMANIDADQKRINQDTAPQGWERVGRGSLDLYQGLKQRALQVSDAVGLTDNRAPDYTARVNAENERYARDRANAGQDGVDWLRLGGTAMAAAPAVLLPFGAATTTGGRIVGGAIGGGATGFSTFDPTGTPGEVAKNTAGGAAVGAVLTPIAGYGIDKIGQGLKALYGMAKGRFSTMTEAEIVQAVPELAQLPPQARRDLISEAQAMVRQTGSLNAEQLGRKANLVANDVTPTRSMVTRDPADWARERNLSKLNQSPDEQLATLGSQLTDTYQANDAALAGRLGGMVRNPATQEAHGMTVMRSVDDLAEASQKDVTNLYNQVRATQGDQLASDARQLWTTLDGLRDNTYAEKLVSSVTNKLRRFGMVDKDGNLTPNSLTVTQAEELRKFVNTLPNDYGKRDIIKAIDADVLSGTGGDAFATARAAAAQRFEMLGNPAAQRAMNTLGELQQGKAAQGFIQQQVVNAADQDVASLVQTIQQIKDPQAQMRAMTAMQDGVLQYLQSKAVNPNSGQFSGAALNRALQELGDAKLLAIFGFQRAQQLRSLSRAALDATYQPPYAAVNSSNTAPMLMSLIERGRGVTGVNLPFGLNQATQTVAARSGYARQLANAMEARAQATPEIPPRLSQGATELARALQAGATPASYSSLDQARKRANRGR